MSDHTLPSRFRGSYWEALFPPEIAEELCRLYGKNSVVAQMIESLVHRPEPREILAILGQTVCHLAHMNNNLTKRVVDFTNLQQMPRFIVPNADGDSTP